MNEVEKFLDSLIRFRKLKNEKWEKIEDTVQSQNPIGTPTEDWIIPPDENIVYEKLKKDSDYVDLRKYIETELPHILTLSQENHFDTNHKLDWITFEEPLISTSALDDAIECLQRWNSTLKK